MNFAKHPERSLGLYTIYGLVLFIVPALLFVFGGLAQSTARVWELNAWQLLIASVIVQSAVLLAVSFFYGVGSANFTRRGAPFWEGTFRLFAGVLGFLGAVAALNGVLVFTGLNAYGALGRLKAIVDSAVGFERIGLAVALGLLPALSEEFFFRGLIFRRLFQHQGFASALLASSFLFGVYHLDWVHSPAAALMGLYLGLLYYLTGSLWISVVAHAVNNFVFVVWAEPLSTSLSAGLGLSLGLPVSVLVLVYLKTDNRGAGSLSRASDVFVGMGEGHEPRFVS